MLPFVAQITSLRRQVREREQELERLRYEAAEAAAQVQDRPPDEARVSRSMQYTRGNALLSLTRLPCYVLVGWLLAHQLLPSHPVER